MKRTPVNLRDAVGVTLFAVMLSGCAAAPPGTAADPTAKRAADREKQAELLEMEKAGKRD